ncbi:beta-ketoacyl synthase N-terminal-like domain-containing protein [Saccharopolyspora sp. NPDC050389]|uniref:beta-ketoacyl synthase N-terminal-like domain-containing protein n=1 Tax=Saccharopolyspora sp. NPDC050389 TaxID=3155516 RepID=UPI0033D78307
MSKLAIVGVSCILPGARTPEQFFENLLEGRDSRREGEAADFGIDPATPGGWGDDRHAVTSRRGGFVDDVEIDLGGLRLPEAWLRRLDRSFHWALHVGREAIADAGADLEVLSGDRVGLVLGNYSFPTWSSCERALPLWQEGAAAGLRAAGVLPPRSGRPRRPATDPANLRAFGLPARVVGEALGLRGPQLALDAACSSALYSLKLAGDYLRAGRADVMLAGALCAPDPVLMHLSFSDLGAYPSNGVSQPFDARSDGIITGQGAGMFVVKRLADALAEGDRIYAVVDGIGLSNDGAGRHLLSPNVEGQLEAYRLAYAEAGVDPQDIDYIECHATGTPLGDSTEADGLHRFFSSPRPALGSVKANVGHLLTVAGFSSVLKLIKSLHEGVIPATPGVEDVINGLGAGEVVSATRDWPVRDGGPRRAAASAFGFGGTNAHLVLSSPEEESDPVPPGAASAPAPRTTPMLITGIGVHVGNIDGRADFERRMFTARPSLGQVLPNRWYGLGECSGVQAADRPAGAYCGSFDIDPLSYRIPPAQLTDFNTQHLLMVKVADEALADAGYQLPGSRSGSPARQRVGVVIAMEMEQHAHGHRARFDIGAHVRDECARAGVALDSEEMAALEEAVRDGIHSPIDSGQVMSYIGNIMASRISSRYDFTGPSFTVASDGAGSAAALDVGRLLLADPSIDAVLVGAVDLAGGVVEAAADDDGPESPAAIGEGAAAVVLTRAGASGEAYACLESLATAYPHHSDRLMGQPDADTVAQSAREALAAAGMSADSVGLVESRAAVDVGTGELLGLERVYADAAGDEAAGPALSSLAPLVGDTRNLAGLLGVVKAALAVSTGTIPPPGPLPEAGEGTEMVPASSAAQWWVAPTERPWLRRTPEDHRVAAVSITGSGGSHAHAIVSGRGVTAPDTSVLRWSPNGPLVLPVQGTDAEDLVNALGALRDELAGAVDVASVVQRFLDEHRTGGLTAVFVADDGDGLRSEVDAASRDLPSSLAEGRIWNSPRGSYCTPRPLHAQDVALVFPGAFSAYPTAAADLFRLAPGLLADFESFAASPDAQFQTDRLHPRRRRVPDRRTAMQYEAELLDDIPTMLAAGTNLAVLHTELLRTALGLPVRGALGYSLGESSMLFALGVWEAAARDDRALRESPLFSHLLTGARTTVRSAWGLGADIEDGQVWSSYLVLGDVEEVARHVERTDRLFLTHINSPTEAVVAGAPEACQGLLDALDVRGARTPTRHIMHCDIVRPHFDELAALNSHPTTMPAGLELFSAFDGGVLEGAGRGELSQRIAETLCRTVDFPKLVRAAYANGHRVFIDVGPAASCTRWVSEILGDLPHLAVAVDRRGISTADGLARAVAMLASHGVPVRLDQLRPLTSEAVRRRVRVECGGESIPERIAQRAQEALDGARPGDAVDERARTQVLEPVPAAPAGVGFVGKAFVPVQHQPIEFGTQAESPITAARIVTQEPGPPMVAPAEPATARADVAAGRPVSEAAVRSLVDEKLRTGVRAAHEKLLLSQKVAQLASLNLLERAVSVGGLAGAATDASVGGALDPAAADPTPDAVRSPEPAQSLVRVDPRIIWNRDDLLEFATGSVAPVFGERFAEVDSYRSRVRLPAPPYLFVDRVVALEGRTGTFEPSSISTEFDIPKDAWFSVDGLSPPAVTIEAGQCDMLLISYLGIDLLNKGDRRYRLLDSTLVFHGDLPHEGQTLRYDISIDRFAWNGDMLMFFFSYLCYADGELILELKSAAAGFFTQEELEASGGVLAAPSTEDRPRGWFKPLAHTDVDRLGAEELEALARGERAAVFGPAHAQPEGANRSLRLPDAKLRLIDEITLIDRTGGPRGLGHLSATAHLDPEGWYFACHFIDDPVLAGSMMAEGGVHLLQVYALSLGMHLCLPDARFQTVPGLRTEVKVRGQVTPDTGSIRYEVDIEDLTLVPRPTVIANITVHDDTGKPIVSMRNFGVQLREKEGTPYRPDAGGIPPFLGRRTHDGRDVMINEMHLAHAARGDLGTAMGPEFDVYHDHRAPHIPNGDFQFVDRIVEMTGERGTFSGGETMITEYDAAADSWYFRETNPHITPNCVLMETSLQAAILLGYYLGVTLGTPEESFSIRNLDGKARLLREVDLRGKTIEHRTTMLSSGSYMNSILQRFSYELCVDGEPFYAGESLFGYFTASALENQVGLDNGAAVPSWLESDGAGHEAVEISADEYRRLILVERHDSPVDHFPLLDRARVVLNGGRQGLGYAWACRRIVPDEWFFDCHFHRDPVMPGSLGVEAMLHALKLIVLRGGLTEGVLDRPVFHVPVDVEMSWRYRGQVLPDDGETRLEVHVTEIRPEADRFVVIADGHLWKGDLRIYEIGGLAVEAREGGLR